MAPVAGYTDGARGKLDTRMAPVGVGPQMDEVHRSEVQRGQGGHPANECTPPHC